MLFPELFETLQNLIQFKPSQQNIADILGVRQGAISNRISRKSPLTFEELQKIENAYKISGRLTGQILNIKQENPQLPDDCIELEHIHINPSCGHGTVVMDEPEITPIKLGTQMIQSVLKISDVKKLKTFKACGDSMETVIEDGDILLVDTGRIDFNNGGIFLLTINNDWYVKRLRKRLSGELDVISDNNKYPIETFKPNDNIEIVVKGRVVKNLSRGL